MACKVQISEQARGFLAVLSQEHPVRCRTLALLLLSLEKQTRPPGSRKLEVDPVQGEEREWIVEGFEILYRTDAERRLVEVGWLGQAT